MGEAIVENAERESFPLVLCHERRGQSAGIGDNSRVADPIVDGP